MKNRFFKNIARVFAIVAGCLMLASFSPSLDGRAIVVDEGVFPSGLFAKTVGYLPGDIISVTNITGDATIDILVIGALDPSEGVAIMLSPEAATAIGMDKDANNIVKITKRSNQDERVYGSAIIARQDGNTTIPAVTVTDNETPAKEESFAYVEPSNENDFNVGNQESEIEDTEDIEEFADDTEDNSNEGVIVEDINYGEEYVPDEEWEDDAEESDDYDEVYDYEDSDDEDYLETDDDDYAEEVEDDEIAAEEYEEEYLPEDDVEAEEYTEDDYIEEDEDSDFEETEDDEDYVEESFEEDDEINDEEYVEEDIPADEEFIEDEEDETSDYEAEDESFDEDIEEETADDEYVEDEIADEFVEDDFEEDTEDEIIESEDDFDEEIQDPVEEEFEEEEEETPEETEEVLEVEEEVIEEVLEEEIPEDEPVEEVEDVIEEDDEEEYDAIVLVPAEENVSSVIEETEIIEEIEEVEEIEEIEIVKEIEEVIVEEVQQVVEEVKPVVTNSSYSKYVVPSMSDLKKGSYYIQISVLKNDANILEITNKYGKKYPLTIVPNADGTKKVMVGPLSVDEYGTVLERFKSYGYKDAFIRKIN